MLTPKLKKEIMDWARGWTTGAKKKSAIFHGPPGVGKTSTPLVLASEMGWTPLELNASDARKKDDIERVVTAASRSSTFSATGEFGGRGGRKLIIMDEADQIHKVRGETSGIRQLIETCKTTLHPIVLTANDYYNLTKSTGSPLRALCQEFKFPAVTRSNRKKFLSSVASAEGLDLGTGALEFLIEQSQGDLRGALRDLESISHLDGPITVELLEELGSRDHEVDVFKGIARIFKSPDLASVSRRRMDLDLDPDTLMLWMDENISSEFPRDQMYSPYRFLARADTFLGRVRRSQAYRFWKHAGVLMTGGVLFGKPDLQHQSRRYSFPSYLRQMGSSRSLRATLKNTLGTIGASMGCSGHVVALEVLPLIRALAEDEPAAREMMLDLGLESDEMAFLMGRKASSKEWKKFIKEVAEMELSRAVEPEITPAAAKAPAPILKAEPPRAAAPPQPAAPPEPTVPASEPAAAPPEPEPEDTTEPRPEKKAKQTALFDF